ncbi:MAG: hypothetical protein JNK86_06765 [Alphaproteobacteria bacterium]|nr:hypothetical protein [Alphaproteobacteria bacterium]
MTEAPQSNNSTKPISAKQEYAIKKMIENGVEPPLNWPKINSFQAAVFIDYQVKNGYSLKSDNSSPAPIKQPDTKSTEPSVERYATQKQLDVMSKFIKDPEKAPKGWPDKVSFDEAYQFIKGLPKKDETPAKSMPSSPSQAVEKGQLTDMVERGLTDNQKSYIDELIKHGHEQPNTYPKITSKEASSFIERAVEEGKKRADLFRSLPPEEGKKKPELVAAYQALSMAHSFLLKSQQYQGKSPEEKQKFLNEMKEIVARNLEQGKHYKPLQVARTVTPEQSKEAQANIKQELQKTLQPVTPQKTKTR